MIKGQLNNRVGSEDGRENTPFIPPPQINKSKLINQISDGKLLTKIFFSDLCGYFFFLEYPEVPSKYLGTWMEFKYHGIFQSIVQ